ncbi:PepSY-associated transmembrane protein [Maribacter spongiicola]|uniref:PepSY-associated transmembrane protein n=1 Tax=Maribacter spongiicola TaxID=1206753 RepID=A0A4R7K6W9_9FLAO|nr:PepSY domain-containing protein [Maribacter spongiicola]TDT46312.1 PepSY-associated transmembrane protein [Maribacter spongiicola]
MAESSKRQRQAKWLRIFRKVHRTTGAALFIFFFIISITGLLLGWKKHSGGILLSKSYEGTSTELKHWLPIDSLHTLANSYLLENVSPELSTKIDRIDIRKDKGMVKFVYDEHYWGLQLDGATGKLLHVEKRYSDLIEQVHDGSIIDDYLGTSNKQIKVFYTSIMGLALLLFTITGFWLWYGPKRMRRNNATA